MCDTLASEKVPVRRNELSDYLPEGARRGASDVGERGPCGDAERQDDSSPAVRQSAVPSAGIAQVRSAPSASPRRAPGGLGTSKGQSDSLPHVRKTVQVMDSSPASPSRKPYCSPQLPPLEARQKRADVADAACISGSEDERQQDLHMVTVTFRPNDVPPHQTSPAPGRRVQDKERHRYPSTRVMRPARKTNIASRQRLVELLDLPKTTRIMAVDQHPSRSFTTVPQQNLRVR